MEIDVRYSVWGASGFDEPFTGGLHTLTDPTEEQLRAIAGAEASGIVTVAECSKQERKVLDGFVQSQEAGEKALAQAMEDGTWHEGNREQFLRDATALLATDTISDELRFFLEKGIADTEAQIAGVA